MSETTTKQFAAKHGVEYAQAAGVIKFLVKLGVASKVRTEPNPAGRGKGSDVFEIPATATITL